MPFSDIRGINTALATLPAADPQAADAARERQRTLTKPPGSLGELEQLAIWMAGWQGRERPGAQRAHCLVFAANHGVARQGVSAFPAAVTAQMVANFEAGGAAINQLCELAGAELQVVPLQLDRPTADFTERPAMTTEEALAAFNAGVAAVPQDAEIVLLGEMGIGNSTAAAALAMVCFGGDARQWTGPGTGLDAAAVERKAALVAASVERHAPRCDSPLNTLACLGGRELTAIAGAVLAARLQGIPVLLDGFICTSAAAVLARFQPAALDHCRVAHCSREPGHRHLLAALDQQPILDLGLRLGEASGAAVALMVVRAALATHNGMASFAEAGVSSG